MWLKKLESGKFGFHPMNILEDGAINWEFHCGCCFGTTEHFFLTPKENEQLFQAADLTDTETSMLGNLLEGEIPLRKRE